MSFWDRFYLLCQEKGKKPNPVGRDIGVSSGIITKWKNGAIPGSDILTRIAEYFNVTTDYLLGKEKSTPIEVHDEDDNIVVLDDETLKIIDDLRTRPEMKMLFSVSSKATPEDIIKAVKIIEALRDDSGHK